MAFRPVPLTSFSFFLPFWDGYRSNKSGWVALLRKELIQIRFPSFHCLSILACLRVLNLVLSFGLTSYYLMVVPHSRVQMAIAI
jgi:hypothetical protein